MIYTKVPKSKQKRKSGWKQDEIDYQKHLESLGLTSYPKKTKKVFKELELKKPVIRETAIVPSLNSNKGSTLKVETTKYTGDKLVGIAVMHKSCLQPVFSQEQATEVAQMRRN